MKIGIAVLCYGGTVRSETLLSFALDLLWAKSENHDIAIYTPDVHGADRARNTCVANARRDELDLLLMLDSDTGAAPNGSALSAMVATMKKHGATAVCAAVPTKHQGYAPNVYPVHPGSTYEAEKAGAAYMLLDMHRLEEIGPGHTWFKWKIDDDGITVLESEDVYFSKKVRARGGRVVVDFQIPTIHAITVPLEMSKLLAAAAHAESKPKIAPA